MFDSRKLPNFFLSLRIGVFFFSRDKPTSQIQKYENCIYNSITSLLNGYKLFFKTVSCYNHNNNCVPMVTGSDKIRRFMKISYLCAFCYSF